MRSILAVLISTVVSTFTLFAEPAAALSAAFLISAAALLILIALPALRAKREVVMQE